MGIDRSGERSVTTWEDYRPQCIHIISKVLKLPEGDIEGWGREFEAMPPHMRMNLIYADALRVQLEAAAESGILELFLEFRQINVS